MAMLQRQTYINDIVNRLSGLASSVELSGLLNLLGLHVISEDFYVDLLNLIYGWKLRNANSLQQNAPGIDLVDDSNRILVQVTGTSTKGKIDHSLKEIPEKYTGYHFYFAPIVIDAKEQRKYKYSPPHEVVFNPKTDILDIQQHLGEILLTLDGHQRESYTFALTLPHLISITLDTCNAYGKSQQWFRSLSACIAMDAGLSRPIRLFLSDTIPPIIQWTGLHADRVSTLTQEMAAGNAPS